MSEGKEITVTAGDSSFSFDPKQLTSASLQGGPADIRKSAYDLAANEFDKQLIVDAEGGPKSLPDSEPVPHSGSLVEGNAPCG